MRRKTIFKRLFDRLKPGKDIYRTNPEFLQLVSNLIGGRKGEKYIASQKMLQDMREQYTEILAIASRVHFELLFIINIYVPFNIPF